MNHNCGNCKHSKKRGFSLCYCLLFGIDISAKYSKCKSHRPRIVEVEHEDDRNGVHKGVWNEVSERVG